MKAKVAISRTRSRVLIKKKGVTISEPLSDGGISTPPKAVVRAESKRERTRELILEGARIALLREGFENITTRHIADQAGVNIATLHYYFNNKETLLSEAVDYAVTRTLRQLRTVIQDAPDAATALELAFQATWEMVKQRPGVLRYDLVVRGVRKPEAHQQAAGIYRTLYGLVGEILDRHLKTGNQLRPGTDREILERYLVAAIDGVVLQHLVFGEDEKTLSCLQLILQHAKMLLVTETAGEPARESADLR